MVNNQGVTNSVHCRLQKCQLQNAIIILTVVENSKFVSYLSHFGNHRKLKSRSQNITQHALCLVDPRGLS